MAFTKPTAAQINFDVTNISDPLICLNYGQSGTPDDDVGIVIERGSSTNVALIWDESADLFALINTTETGTTAGNVSIASYAGLTVGQLSLADSAKIYLGTGNDLELYHNGNNSFISDQGTGGIYVLTNDFLVKNAANDETFLRASGDGDVELYYDNSQKLVTTTTGISVTGAITATGTSTSALLTLTTTEASASASPVIVLKRNSSSPADSDSLGQIKFLGENDADEEVEYGRITTTIFDASNGSEDGKMQVKLMEAGTLTNSMRFEPQGIFLNTSNTITFEGATADNYETILTVVDPTGDRTVSLPNITGTVITTGDTGTVSGTMVADNAIDSDHYTDGSIDTAHYAAGSVDATALGADAVTAAKIGDDVINSEHYVAGSIDNEHLADDAVNSDELAAGAVDLAHMSANSVDSDQYVDGSIDLAHMSANSVDSDQYVDASIDLAHMSANSVDSDQYVDDSIDTAHYASGSVDTTALGADAVTAAKIGDNVINSEHYAAGSIDLEHMSSESVDEDNLHISNSPTNGYMLTAQSGNAGGLTWAVAGSGTITALNNKADNRLVSIGSTTTELDGEANLTFDGSILAVTGNVTASGTVEPAGDTASGDNAAIGYTSAEGLILTGQGSTSDITFKNDADTTVMSIKTGTSSVGIGTTAPHTTLHIDEASGTNPATTGTTTSGSVAIQGQNSVLAIGAQTSLGNVWMQAANINALGTSRSIIINPNGGKVGIGVAVDAAPARGLHVESGSDGNARAIRIAYDGSYYLDILQEASTGTAYNTVGGKPHIWRQAGSEVMRIDASGNLGVGIAPAARLHIKQAANGTNNGFRTERSDTTGYGVIYMGGDDDLYIQNQANGDINWYTNAALKMSLKASGDLILASTGGTFQTATAGTSNFRAGVNAGNSIASGGNYNVAVGDEAGTAITTGDNNVAIGYAALQANTTGYDNVAIGRESLGGNTTGTNNTATGRSTLLVNTTGASNTSAGFEALKANTTASYNTATGYRSLTTNTTGYSNTAAGSEALRNNTTGYYNAAFGANALYYNTTGYANIAAGYQALNTNTTGSENTATGKEALQANTTGGSNVAAGNYALYANTTGASNVAVGMQALTRNTTASYNTATGKGALYENTTGALNIGIGYGAGDAITTGSNNTIIGDYAGSTTLADTVVIAAGTTERIKVDSNGLYVNGTILAGGNTVSQDNSTNTAFNLYYATTTSGALTALKYDGADMTFNPSTSTLACTNITGTSSAAQYADLAEMYAADKRYGPGTILVFGGESEVTSCKEKSDSRVVGIVSPNPAYLMNSALNTEYAVPVALVGRVFAKVTGKVSKGDLMVTSEVEGHAESWHAVSFPPAGSILGKAVEDKAGIANGIIEILVGIS